MKNPNGYGCVYRLSGKRRKPFGVRITTGYSDTGTQLYKPIGYFTKREEAIIALAEYNKNPYDLDTKKITFADVYKKWSAKKYTSKISDTNIKGYRSAFNKSELLYNMIFSEIRTDHMQAIIDKCDKGHSTLSKLKVLYGQLYNYAVEHDIVNKNYATFVNIGEDEDESTRIPFTQKEINLLWDNVGEINLIDTILIMIYSGLRVGELLIMKTDTIDIENRTMRGGIKTKAGKNRIIPINKKIVQMVKTRLVEGHDYLIVEEGQPMTYSVYYEQFKLIMAQLHIEHKTHDCRHTFATLMDNAGANKLSIKRIMGHASRDITDGVYTHKDIEELKKAVDLI
jgi:integrase